MKASALVIPAGAKRRAGTQEHEPWWSWVPDRPWRAVRDDLGVCGYEGSGSRRS